MGQPTSTELLKAIPTVNDQWMSLLEFTHKSTFAPADAEGFRLLGQVVKGLIEGPHMGEVRLQLIPDGEWGVKSFSVVFPSQIWAQMKRLFGEQIYKASDALKENFGVGLVTADRRQDDFASSRLISSRLLIDAVSFILFL